MDLIPGQPKTALCGGQIPRRHNARSPFQTRVRVDYLNILGVKTEAPALLKSLKFDQGCPHPRGYPNPNNPPQVVSTFAAPCCKMRPLFYGTYPRRTMSAASYPIVQAPLADDMCPIPRRYGHVILNQIEYQLESP